MFNLSNVSRFTFIGLLAISATTAQASYDRTCGYKVESPEAYIPLVAEVTTTIVGEPSGSIRKKKIRLAAKENAGNSALRCINEWVSTNFQRIEEKKLTGKTSVPLKCENPTWVFNENYEIMEDIYFTKNTDHLSFSFSKLLNSLTDVCDGHSGTFEIAYTVTQISGDDECPNGSDKTYELICKSGKPVSVNEK